MNRRSLLLGLGAALSAPAIVKAESLMKLWVPPKPKLITAWVAGTADFIDGVIWRSSQKVGYYSRVGKIVTFEYNISLPSEPWRSWGTVSTETFGRVLASIEAKAA